MRPKGLSVVVTLSVREGQRRLHTKKGCNSIKHGELVMVFIRRLLGHVLKKSEEEKEFLDNGPIVVGVVGNKINLIMLLCG